MSEGADRFDATTRIDFASSCLSAGGDGFGCCPPPERSTHSIATVPTVTIKAQHRKTNTFFTLIAYQFLSQNFHLYETGQCALPR